MTNIDKIVEQAHRSIDQQSEYKIPKPEQWKKTNKTHGKKVSVCKCGAIILHKHDKHPERCKDCRKKISNLFKLRMNKAKNKENLCNN